ncbi:MAG: c-type cytochrome domain-containing protein, partial [Verrucomicrobiota bacterium]|nr:c-type cytochrome domain-containing protein [Verrucomicrobiota bacterium]
MNRPRGIAFLLLLAVVLPLGQARADKALNALKPFLRTHCLECHGPDKQKNEIRFDTLGTDLTDLRTLEIWQDALDQLNLGEMPPKKAAQPKRADTAKFIDALSLRLELAYKQRKSTGGQTVIRRLNRLELRSTLRDLLYLQGAAYRPGAVSGLVDNNGNGRVERKGNDPVRFFPEEEL